MTEYSEGMTIIKLFISIVNPPDRKLVNLNSVHRSLKQFFLTVGRNPFRNKILFLKLRLSVAAVITRVSNIGDEAGVGFLKDALTVVENVHRQFAGKLVNFLVHKFLVGPHLSLTRQAQCSNF